MSIRRRSFLTGATAMAATALARPSAAGSSAAAGEPNPKETIMATFATDGIELYYELHGEAGNPPVLLIAGLGGRGVRWGREWGGAMTAPGGIL